MPSEPGAQARWGLLLPRCPQHCVTCAVSPRSADDPGRVPTAGAQWKFRKQPAVWAPSRDSPQLAGLGPSPAGSHEEATAAPTVLPSSSGRLRPKWGYRTHLTRIRDVLAFPSCGRLALLGPAFPGAPGDRPATRRPRHGWPASRPAGVGPHAPHPAAPLGQHVSTASTAPLLGLTEVLLTNEFGCKTQRLKRPRAWAWGGMLSPRRTGESSGCRQAPGGCLSGSGLLCLPLQGASQPTKAAERRHLHPLHAPS